ncbi:unnamed protein product, partial [Iphiclides podalirius]
MALFPAYASKVAAESNENDEQVRWDVNMQTVQETNDAMEAQLLASDTEDESDTSVHVVPKPDVTYDKAANEDFYVDCKMDCGPCRYECGGSRLGVGGRGGAERGPRRRYFRRRVPDEPEAAAVAERAASYRRLLEETPRDVALWERYIDFMERCGTEQEAVDAAELAVERAGHSRRLRARLYDALRRSLSTQPYAERLRKSLTTERDMDVRLELWIELMNVLGSAPDASTRAVTTVAGAALADMRPLPSAYPDLLYHFGLFIRAGGLWEQLVQLIELVAAMNFPPAPFPPPVDREQRRRCEQRLRDIEDQAIASGLPLSAVWVRVERARAATRWRPATDEEEDEGDPQRRPLPHDVAELLQPVADPHQLFRLSVRMLMLAKVPLLCGAGWGAPGALGFSGECAEGLLPLAAEARLLPPAHPAHARPAPARLLLAHFLDPPHYFADDQGYLSWVGALWEACWSWAGGARREALLCWRLRWLRALALAGADEVEARRVRGEARALLKRAAGGAPLPFAEWARLEGALGGAPHRALRGAKHALRAALADEGAPHCHLLYIARVVCEVDEAGGDGGVGQAGGSALVAAVLRRADRLDAPPQPADLQLALQRCEEECEALEREFEGVGPGGAGGAGDEEWALLPSRAEWGAVRALLAAPRRRAQLLARLLERPYVGDEAEAARYWEQSGTVLARASRSSAVAGALARHCAHSPYLAVAGAGAPLWGRPGLRGAGGGGGGAPPPASCGGAMLALCGVLPQLLRALESDWAPEESDALARAARRVLGAAGGVWAGGALGGAVRLEAEGRAARPRLPHALYAALAAAPHHKWLHVRGAAWCGGEAAALADMLLDKLLRLHALPHELLPLELPPATAAAGAVQQQPDRGGEKQPDASPERPDRTEQMQQDPEERSDHGSEQPAQPME